MKNSGRRNSLKTKLIFSYIKIVAVLFIVLLSGVAALKIHTVQQAIDKKEKTITNSLYEKGNILTENNRIALKDLAVNNAITAVKHLISTTVHQDKELLYGIFMDRRLIPWAKISYDDSLEQPFHTTPLKDTMALWASKLTTLKQKRCTYKGHPIIEFAAPIDFEGTTLGFIRYGFSEEFLQESLKSAYDDEIEERNQILLIIGILSLMALFISILMARRTAKQLSKPVLSLVTSTQIISNGQYDHLISPESNDEIGDLAVHISQMQESIREKIEALDTEISYRKAAQTELEKAHDELERRVVERTEELRIANAALVNANAIANAASEAKSSFLANMSHEIRTPMNAILGFTEVLLKKVKDKEYYRYLSIIDGSGKTLLKLINDILDLSKVEAGKLEIEYVPFSLKHLCEEISTMFSKTAEEKNLSLSVEEKSRFKRAVILDEVRIREILINLVGNALKFTSKGYIKVRLDCVELDERYMSVSISVLDTGIGIPKSQVDHIFGAFDQVQGQKNSEYGGTGLGLSITQKLVHLMNGTIKVESEEGKGSSFNINFEKVETAPLEESENLLMGAGTKVHFTKGTILISETSEEAKELIACYFEGSPLTIHYATTVEETINKLEEYTPHLLFINLSLIVNSDKHFYKMIEEYKRSSKTHIVFVTASVLHDRLEEYKEISDALLTKPLSFSDVVSVAQKALPYKETKKEVTKSEINNDKAKFSGSEECMQRLKKLLPQIEKYQKAIVFSEIAQLSKELLTLAEKFDHSLIHWYGEELRNAVNSYDIAMILNKLNKFKQALQ